MTTFLSAPAWLLAAALVAPPFGPIPMPTPGPGNPPVGNLPPGTPKPGEPLTIYADCSAKRTIKFADEKLMMEHALGDRNLARRPDLHLKARVRHSASRVFLTLEGWIDERNPTGPLAGLEGQPDTRYANAIERVRMVDVPEGCEIKSVSATRGSLTTKRNITGTTIYSNGVLDEARCWTVDRKSFRSRQVGCKEIKFRAFEVRFRNKTNDCADVTITPIPAPIWGLRRKSGDTEMNGNRPHVRLDTDVVRFGTRVRLDSTLEIKEDGGDRSRMGGTYGVELFDAGLDAPGCKVASVSYESGRLRGQTVAAGDIGGRVYGRAPNPEAEGILATAQCVTDTPGTDEREIGCAAVYYRPLTIRLEKK